MEIKQGDKVKVSKDAPKVYLSSVNNLFKYHVCKVEETDGDSAKIRYTDIGIDRWLVIPTKYLVKVDAEAFRLADVVSDAGLHQDNYLNEDKKEAKFKVGDVVRIKPTADKLHQGYQNGYAWLPERDEYLGRVASVKEIWCDGSIILNIRNNMLWEPIDLESYVEPMEQTEANEDMQRHKDFQQLMADSIAASKKCREEYIKFMEDCMSGEIYTQSDFLEDYDPSKHEVNPKPRRIPKIMLNTEFWVKYEADLAKELSVVYAKQGIDPIEAVGKAKEIIKQLKQNK